MFNLLILVLQMRLLISKHFYSCPKILACGQSVHNHCPLLLSSPAQFALLLIQTGRVNPFVHLCATNPSLCQITLLPTPHFKLFELPNISCNFKIVFHFECTIECIICQQNQLCSFTCLGVGPFQRFERRSMIQENFSEILAKEVLACIENINNIAYDTVTD